MTIDVFAVIADQTRRRILGAVKDSPRPVNDIVTELGVSQPTVSKHLKVLREAGLVSMRAAGQRRLYSIDAEPLGEVVSWAASLGVPAEEAAERGEAAGPAEALEAREASSPTTAAGTQASDGAETSAGREDADAAPPRPATFPSTAAEPPAPLAVPPNDPVPSDERGGASEPSFASRHARVIFQPLAPLAPKAAPTSSRLDDHADGTDVPASAGAGSAAAGPATGAGEPSTTTTSSEGEPAPAEPAAPVEPAAGQAAPADEPEAAPGEPADDEPVASPQQAPASSEPLTPQETPHAAEPAEEPEAAAEGVSGPEDEADAPGGAEPAEAAIRPTPGVPGPAPAAPGPASAAPEEAPDAAPALDPLAHRQRDADHEAESKPTGFLANLFGKRRAR